MHWLGHSANTPTLCSCGTAKVTERPAMSLLDDSLVVSSELGIRPLMERVIGGVKVDRVGGRLLTNGV